ncbi:hypothetical protein PY650_11325 [Rhizobium calliandrae]|uniref:Uncharacterized protein n=1 Tax=Rhizobium calliandrae TaxID=1312182 RepID=A0ABT7KCA4_9HYPH|nr:hypothetical protein [Rhizobium calliandrae]MDL2406239.1 hypothetical protein [Rhizobium calliandrae]
MKRDEGRSTRKRQSGKRRQGGSLDAGREAVNQVEGEFDSRTKHAGEIAPDDVANTKTMKEAARQHRDTFVVDGDLDDEDQRNATPSTREQD